MLGEDNACQASFFFPPAKLLLYKNGKLTSSFADILLYGYALMVVFANGDLSTLYERRMQRFLSWDFSICAVLLSSEDETCLQHCVYGWQPLLTLSDTIENLSEQVPFLLVLVCMLMRHNLHVKIVYQLFSTLSMPTYAM